MSPSRSPSLRDRVTRKVPASIPKDYTERITEISKHQENLVKLRMRTQCPFPGDEARVFTRTLAKSRCDWKKRQVNLCAV